MDAPLNAEVHRLEEATWKPWGGKPAPHASTSIGIIGKWQNLLRRRALVPNAFTNPAELEVLNFIPHILEMRPSCVFCPAGSASKCLALLSPEIARGKSAPSYT